VSPHCSAGAPHAAQSSMGMTDASHSHVSHSSSVQHSYNPVEYANYYYSYPQAANDSSVHQGAHQHPGAAYQPFTSFQNSGSYIDPTSNTYYKNNTWDSGSSGNNYSKGHMPPVTC